MNEIQSNFSHGKYKRSKADTLLLESPLFQKIVNIFNGMVQYISLQDRVNTELGVFGSNQVRNDFQVSPPIQSIRQLIRIMISFLFNGVETKIGKEDADLSGQLKEIRSVVLHRYLNTSGAKFTYKIADGLYYRIQYYFYPEKRSEDNELSVTPAQFGELLWQFMYYAFEIDFHMLRIDEINSKQQIKEWCSLAETLLNKIKEIDSLPESEKLPVLRETIMKRYSRLQIRFEKTHPIRFTLEEIDCFRGMEAIADEKYREIIQREKYGDENKEAIEMAAQITTFLCRKKCGVAFNKIKEAIECLEYIKARELKDIEDKYPGSTKKIVLLSSNNRYNIYASMKDETGERVSVSKLELDELFLYVAVSITANRYELCHIDMRWIKKNLQFFMRKLSECENTDYGLKLELPTKKDFRKHFNEVNESLFRYEEVKYLKQIICIAYKYVLYSEWIDNNMHLYF